MNANLASHPQGLPGLPGKPSPADNTQLFVNHGLLAPGVKLFRNLRFRAKTGLIALAIMLPLLGLLIWQLAARHQDAIQGRMDALQYNVEIAHGILAWAHGQQAAAGLSREDAQQLARRAIADLRYDEIEYFWINDMQARMVMHPIQPHLDNTNVSGMRDPNGLYLFREFVDTVRRDGEGFVAYQWPKPGLTEPVDKISFVKGFEPWGWVIGTGVYVDDLRALALRRIGLSAAVVLIVLLVAGYRRNASSAEDGERIMRDVVATMDGIRESSSRISEIINTIDSIAFQTNILALNAAVEAARTGEQGRGFAVVATEVRMLAQRTASAADEIKRLIETSVEQVRAGTAVVRSASDTIEDIRTSSQRVNQLLGEIAVGAREQSIGVDQIGQAVQELDRMTQENAAMVEQTASATTAMRDQALRLAGEVARFRLPENQAAGMSGPRAARLQG